MFEVSLWNKHRDIVNENYLLTNNAVEVTKTINFQITVFIYRMKPKKHVADITYRHGYRNSLRGMRDFEKGKLYKKGKKGNFLFKLSLYKRSDSNVFY